MPNVVDAFDLIEQLEDTHVAVRSERCVALRHIKAGCTSCLDACPAACISIVNREIVIDKTACLGCGVCVSACPTEALVAEAPTDDLLLDACRKATRASEDKCVIACKPMLLAAKNLCDTDKVAGVACLGRIDESILVALAREEHAKSIRLIQGNCETCEYQLCTHTIQMVCDEAKVLLEAVGASIPIEIAQTFPAFTKAEKKNYNTHKRSFFQGMKGEAKGALAKTAQYAAKKALNDKEKRSQYVKVTEAGILPQHMPRRYMRLLDALDPVDLQDHNAPILTRLWGSIRRDRAKCTTCHMCTTFCPTGALSKLEEEGFVGLEYVPAYCVQCRCCADICPNKALSVSNEVFLDDVLSGVTKRYRKKVNDPEKATHHLNAIKPPITSSDDAPEL